MKCTVLQENLKKALASLQKAIPSKPQLPILSSILLDITTDAITLSATDLYLGITTTIPCNSDEEKRLVVPGEVFKKLLTSLPAGEVEFMVKDSTLQIKTKQTKTKLSFQSAEEYPEFPEVFGKEFSINLDTLQEIESKVSFATSTDQSRPVLTTVLFSSREEKVEFVGTDGFRLAVCPLDLSVSLESPLLFPVKALREVLRIASQQKVKSVSFTISEELKQVLAIVDGTKVFIRMIEGSYPPYEKIIPDDFQTTISINGDELLSQIKRAMVFAQDTSNIVKLSFNSEFMTISATSPAAGEYTGNIPIENSQSDEGEIAFNALYLLDFLQAVKPEFVEFSMNESLKPARFRPVDVKDYIYIIMPFRVNS